MILFWLLLLSCGLLHVITDGQAKNLECYNDYEHEMVCMWEVEILTRSCRDQYLLKYEHLNYPSPSNTCIPENMKVGDDILFSKCSCTIFFPYFFVSDDYNIEILYNKKVVLNDTVTPLSIVKPIPPQNLTVTKNENGNFILRWDKSYNKFSILYDMLDFEATYYNKQNPEKSHTARLSSLETSYKILTKELDPGDYVAKVRSHPTKTGGQWSEWSSVVEWRKEYEFSQSILLWINVPIFSIVIMAVIIICYLYHDKYIEWWNNIPDPAKSTSAVNIFYKLQFSALRKEQCVCDQKTSSPDTILKRMKNNFRNWLAKSVPLSLGENCFHEDYTHDADKCGADHCQDKHKAEGERAAISEEAGRILIPEQALVERIEICLLEAADPALLFEDDCETSEDKDTEEVKVDSIILFDSGIQNLFLNIIENNTWQTNSDFFEDKYKLCNSHEIENANQEIYRASGQHFWSKPSSFPMEDCSLEQNYRNNFVQSVKPTSSHGCKREKQEDLLKLMLDSQGLPHLEAFSDGLGGFTHESNVFFDADYHSFDSTVSKCEDQTNHVECCPTNMDFDLISSQDEELSFLMPARELYEIARPKVSNSMSSDNSNILNMSGYQSFDNAVKQDKMQDDQTVNYGAPNRTIPEESGYKPFDCASVQSTYIERGIGTPDLYPVRDRECDCSDSLFPLYFNKTYENNEKSDEIGDSQSGSINSGSQHCNNTGSISNAQNRRSLDRNSNMVYALTFDICDHLKNFGNSSTDGLLLNKEGNTLDCPGKVGDSPHCVARLPLLLQKKSLEAVMTEQVMMTLNCGLCAPSVDFPPLKKRQFQFLNCQTKFENISYFIQPCSAEKMLGFRHDKVPPLDGGGCAKHYLMGLKGDEDGEDNFYMEVTTQMDLQQLDSVKPRESIH
uniref:Interleukin-4 receptor subunit alpha n=1 Tax=Geotrypetes seraphini TaxID=260995 RepID=A0A6P8NJU1_GEOSA|nr:interleukin-4 receptor subunit alpha [Geotrypetes seraphini]